MYIYIYTYIYTYRLHIGIQAHNQSYSITINFNPWVPWISTVSSASLLGLRISPVKITMAEAEAFRTPRRTFWSARAQPNGLEPGDSTNPWWDYIECKCGCKLNLTCWDFMGYFCSGCSWDTTNEKRGLSNTNMGTKRTKKIRVAQETMGVRWDIMEHFNHPGPKTYGLTKHD